MGKTLKLNCAVCDARKLTEDALAGYDAIKINTACLITGAASRALLAKQNVKMNCAYSVDLDEQAKVSAVNGGYRITADAAPIEKQVLVVNGTLEVDAGAQEALAMYQAIIVNGSVIYPESIRPHLGMLTINGSSLCYPDGAVLLERNAQINRTFALRARDKLYFAPNRLIMTDANLDPAALKAKGTRFTARKAILAGSKAEALAELIDERTQIDIVPDGTAVITDDLTLNDAALKRYGTKLYILGDLMVGEDAQNAVAQLEYLAVYGDVAVAQALYEPMLAAADIIDGDVVVFKGRRIASLPALEISRQLLEHEEAGVFVSECGTVTLAPDIDRELIADRLSISACGTVYCSPEQADAVSAVASYCGAVCTDAHGTQNQPEETDNFVKINTTMYTF